MVSKAGEQFVVAWDRNGNEIGVSRLAYHSYDNFVYPIALGMNPKGDDG